MTATEYVILVNENNREIGIADKLTAHQNNLLHRAFSVFIFRNKELLLQQRAVGKYHSPGLWTNTCCSHPRPDEDITFAALRRLREEFGIITTLKDLGWFYYNAHFANGLSEHEIDHVLIGHIAEDVNIIANPEEIQAYRWITLADLRQELASQPELFTPWLAKALELLKHPSPAAARRPLPQGESEV